MSFPLLRKMLRARRWLVPQSLATRASLATSIVFLAGVAVMASVSLQTFDKQLSTVLSSEQDLLVGRIGGDTSRPRIRTFPAELVLRSTHLRARRTRR